MTTKKPLVLEADGVIGQLPNGGIINAGGTSAATFTVGGRGLLFDDGTSTGGGGGGSNPQLTLQGVYDSSTIPAGRSALLSLASDKDFTIGSQTSDDVFFTINGATGLVTLSESLNVSGDISILGNISLLGKINNVDLVLLKNEFDKHLAGDAGLRHLAVNVDITPIPGLPAGTSTVQAALSAIYNASQFSTTELDAVEASLGGAINPDGTYKPSGFTNVPTILVNPTSFTNAIQQLATAIQVNAVNRLANLLDVGLSAPASGNFLRYDGTKWANFALSLSTLAGVSLTTPTAGDILKYDGGTWVNGVLNLDALSDVAITAPSTGNVLYHNGTQFVNGAPGATSGVQAYSALLAAMGVTAPTANQLIYTTGATTVATTDLSPFMRGALAAADASAARTALGVQDASAALASLAAGGTGMVAFSGTTASYRTLVAPASGITISNADGSAGNPTFALSGNLAGLEAVATDGLVTRTAAGTFASRQITGTSGNISVTNGSGITGDISINLATVSQPGTDGDFVKVKTDSFGRVVDSKPVTSADISALMDTAYVNAAGDTLTGSLTMTGGAKITGLPTPTDDSDAATKAYVDTAVQGLSWKEAVRVATTAAISLTSDLAVGDVIDGVTLAVGDRVLVKDQTALSENGIYVISVSGVPVRAMDMNTVNEFDGAAVFVKEGTSNESTGWTQTKTVTQIGTSDVVWSLFAANTKGDSTTIPLGNPPAANISAGAIPLTTTTSVGDSVALINQLLGKLVPTSPPNFPGSQTLTVSGLSSYRMADFTQTDNTVSLNKSVAGGTVVNSVRRAASFTSNTISNVGPGNSGTVTARINGVSSGSVTLTDALTGAGTYGSLVISNNVDLNTITPTTAAGFWSVFSASLSGTAIPGWNEAVIVNTATGTTSTNAPSWYYDSSTPGTPQITGGTLSPPGTPNVLYSSTVPHYTSSNSFTVNFSVNRLSGDTYPVSDTFMTGSARGAFSAPASRTYSQAGISTPLARNAFVSSGTASVSTTASIIAGFGSSTQGPSVSVANSYATGSANIDPGVTILYKTGTSNSLEETAIQIGSTIGSGSGAAARIINPGSSDTPAFTASASTFNSETSALRTYDATVVAGSLKHDETDYSTGYLPVGPNLSSGRSGAQYFTFKFTRSSVSKFDIRWSGTLAGLWIAVPGSTIDTSSTLNGWLDMSVPYAGAGVPGAGTGGNGSNGCSLGGVAPLNAAQTNKSVTATFGTVSSSNTATNEIYVRIKLTSGQSISALSLHTASN